MASEGLTVNQASHSQAGEDLPEAEGFQKLPKALATPHTAPCENVPGLGDACRLL